MDGSGMITWEEFNAALGDPGLSKAHPCLSRKPPEENHTNPTSTGVGSLRDASEHVPLRKT
eukprot:3606591-Amphidinium_carterae.1